MDNTISTGPLGPTDPACCIDVPSLRDALHDGESNLKELWSGRVISEWVKKLGLERSTYTAKNCFLHTYLVVLFVLSMVTIYAG